ncbi:MAG TPA: GlsB/YeaQ/YmgE family stress response membrane protein [Candidatus Saccharimonadales bacterium]|nr:GlsB/YeaQ/YmgE family stress response membrane protein [Candidatus Saccharimonadales bacterium]
MGIILILIIGAIVGWVAGAIMGRREGILGSIGIGIVGAIIGGLVSSLFTSGSNSFLSLNLAGTIWSLIGAVIFVAILNAFQSRSSHNHI